MWSKAEAQKKRIQFFTNLGAHMQQHTGDWGEKIKWVNYPTGVKGLFIKLRPQKKALTFAIEISSNDAWVRSILFEQLEEFKTLLSSEMDDLNWEENHQLIDGKTISQISTTLENVNLYLEEDHPKIFSWYEKNILGFHNFWESFKPVFEDLVK